MSTHLPWFRQDSNIASQPRTLRLMKRRDGAKAFSLWVFADGYCADHGTDGVIDRDVLSIIHGTDALAQVLVDEGWWVDHPAGFKSVGYAERQQIALVTAVKRKAQSLGGRKGNCKKWGHPEGCECWKDAGTDDQ